MSLPITPSAEELRAVKALHAASDGESLLGETHAAAIIAKHTRHEGETARYWQHRFQMEKHRAEAAEARVKELEAGK